LWILLLLLFLLCQHNWSLWVIAIIHQ
jgi:hypothetical protein